ncbi:MAG TPA: TetR/AcrR family transcriptional regulator [Longimicrobiales bacterium]|nr:TetR/AcrR family transcriptional regulator [Longimicrobiales bacterium]
MGISERRQREFLRREREILDAALALFTADDWQAVTVEQIAERAEIGKGTVYKHFAGKDEIYARLAAEFQERALAQLEAIDPGLPVLQRLRMIIAVFWTQHRSGAEHQNLVRYCEREDFRNNLSPEARAELVQLDARLEAAIGAVLRDGIEQGILPRKTPQQLVFGPMAALTGATRMMWGGCAGDTGADQYLVEITNFILAGMLYQEWLAEEGLGEDEATRRALAELAAAQAD